MWRARDRRYRATNNIAIIIREVWPTKCTYTCTECGKRASKRTLNISSIMHSRNICFRSGAACSRGEDIRDSGGCGYSAEEFGPSRLGSKN
ncbi:uncharacterized protein LOC116845656 isoform X3 [Odontomachus brunneus]|uniref:uncharacterized protein LOC116845656 isoform X3 n=1 Tax=Odontomachus brunneus TaxID=486640 RepID=UPI0013F1ED67|nr:uncharacterized protein LOC116845656 isoform X3 [Odontomachus brunneus]